MTSIEQIRAARALLGWSQKDLAERAGLSQTGIARIENGSSRPTTQTLDLIGAAFRAAYIEFIPDGVRRMSDIVSIREGADCYLAVLDEAFGELAYKNGEMLFWAADERRSGNAVIEKTRALRRAGVKIEFLIRDRDTFLMGRPEEYRWLDEALFADGDVKMIFSNRVCHLVSWRENLKTITLRDDHMADEERRLFDYFWNHAKRPQKSTASVSYDE